MKQGLLLSKDVYLKILSTLVEGQDLCVICKDIFWFVGRSGHFYVSTCFSLSFLLQESQQETLKLKEEVSRLRQESSDWSTQSQSQEAELQREREERKRELEKEREERTADVQEITEHYKKESTVLNRDF